MTKQNKTQTRTPEEIAVLRGTFNLPQSLTDQEVEERVNRLQNLDSQVERGKAREKARSRAFYILKNKYAKEFDALLSAELKKQGITE